MRKSFGMVVLVIVMAVVLLLVAEAWKKLAPAAIDVQHATAGAPVSDHGQTAAGAELRSGRLPRLHDAQQRTDAHADDVKRAFEAGE